MKPKGVLAVQRCVGDCKLNDGREVLLIGGSRASPKADSHLWVLLPMRCGVADTQRHTDNSWQCNGVCQTLVSGIHCIGCNGVSRHPYTAGMVSNCVFGQHVQC